MNMQSCINNYKQIENLVLQFINNENNWEEEYENLAQFLNDLNIKNNPDELRLFLRLIEKIAKHHYHTKDFYVKIEKIISIFTKEIQKYYKNNEIFFTFKGSKRILLFLIENKILVLNKDIVSFMISDRKQIGYFPYFIPEIKPIYNDLINEFGYIKYITSSFSELLKKLPPNYYENRMIGENESHICEIIRNDSIEEFITYVNKTDLSLNSKIEKSIFETNHDILANLNVFGTHCRYNLIEYAAFFGSIQIIRYLFKNGVTLSSDLWKYAMHCQNQELIDFLETNQVEQTDNNEYDLLYYSIKYHNVNMTNYMINNYFYNVRNFDKYFEMACKNSNFDFFDKIQINETCFYYLCKYNYYKIVQFFVKNINFDINSGPDSPLNAAIKKGNINLAKTLISIKNINVNKVSEIDGKTALTIAINDGQTEIAKLLLARNDIDVNTMAIVRDFHDHGNFEIENKLSPIILAIGKDIEIVKLLLSFDNIDPNLGEIYEDCIYYTPLCWAIKYGNIEDVRLLLNNQNIDVNLCSKFRDEFWSPLYFAINEESSEIIKLLLKFKDINIKCVYETRCGKESAIELIHEIKVLPEKNEIISLLRKMH